MEEKKYTILEHTADIKVVVYGKSLRELFENSVLALAEVLSPEIPFLSKVCPIYSKRGIKVSSYDIQTLLVDFLSEVNFLSEKNKEVYLKCRLLDFSEENKNLVSLVFGKKVKSFKLQVKGVTFYGLNIEKEDEFYKATVTFDI
ncbi:Protein archease [bacterium HR34]|nr:Protein archease [bacterium HR34]